MPLRLLAFVLAPALLLAACAPPTQAKRQAPERPVLAALVHYEPLARERVLPGVVKPRIETDLAFRVPGKLAQRLVDAGALVKKGDALARLDDGDLRLQVEQAEADYASARAGLDQQEGEERRIDALKQRGWTSNADADKVKAAADQARSAFARAERAVTLARNAAGYATLVADADGVISAVLAEPGQVLAAGAPVVRLAHTGDVEAAVAIPEELVDRARGAPARVEFWALPGLVAPGRVHELSPTADPTTRAYQARYALPDPPAGVRLGMSLTVTLAERSAKVARLPLAALFDRGKGPSLWVVDRQSGAVTETPVRIAGYDNESVLVIDGVAEGASVVALGVHKLDAGQKVRVVDNLAGS